MSESTTSLPRTQRSVFATVAFTNGIPPTLSFTVLAILVERAGGSSVAVSMVVTVHFVGILFFAPVWGAVADITGRRRGVIVGTTALATVALVLIGITSSVVGYIGLRGLYAVFFAGFAPLMFTIVSEHGGVDGRGRLLGEFNSARSVGFALGQFLAGVFIARFTSFEIFLVLGVTSFITLLGTVYVDDPSPIERTTPTLSDLFARVRTRLVPISGKRGEFWDSGLFSLYLGTVLQSIAFFGLLSLLPVYLVSEVGVAEVLVGVFLAINPGGRVLFMYVFGHFSDTRTHKPMILIGLLGTGVFTVTMAVASVPGAPLYRQGLATLALIAIAIALSAFTIGSLAFISAVAPLKRESELMGLRDTARAVGGIVGPVLLGSVVTLLGFERGFLVWTLFPLLGTAIVVRGLGGSGESTTASAS